MITLLKKIAIRPMDDAFNIVTLTNIMEGVDGAAAFGYNLETVALQVEDNQTQQYKHIHTFDVRVIEESSDSAIIDGWIASQTRVEISGQGIDGLFFMSDVLLTRNKQYDEVFASAFFATAETLTSYTTGQTTSNVARIVDNTGFQIVEQPPEKSNSLRQQIYAGNSLIDRFDTTLSSYYTVGSDTIQNGFLPSSNISSNVNVVDGVVTLTATETGVQYFFGESYFAPYTDQIYVATINVTSINSNNATGPEFGISWYSKVTVLGTKYNIYAQRVVQLGLGQKSVVYRADDIPDLSEVTNVQIVFRTRELDQQIQYDSIEFYTTDILQSGLQNQTTVLDPDPNP